MKKLYVASRESGDFIEEVKTLKEGLELIAEFELKDKEEGVFEENFYEVEDEEHIRVNDKVEAIIFVEDTKSHYNHDWWSDDCELFDTWEEALEWAKDIKAKTRKYDNGTAWVQSNEENPRYYQEL